MIGQDGAPRRIRILRLLSETRFTLLLTYSLYSLGTQARSDAIRQNCSTDSEISLSQREQCEASARAMLVGGFDMSRPLDVCYVAFIVVETILNLYVLAHCLVNAWQGVRLATGLSDLKLCFVINKEYANPFVRRLRMANTIVAALLGALAMARLYLRQQLPVAMLSDMAPSAVNLIIALANLHSPHEELAKVRFAAVIEELDHKEGRAFQWSDLVNTAANNLIAKVQADAIFDISERHQSAFEA